MMLKEHGQNHNMRPFIDLRKSCLPLLLFSILGIALGYGIANIVRRPFDEGAFVRWKSLHSRQAFTQILDANSGRIWAKTDDGRIYYRKMDCFPDSNCGTWIETSSVNNEYDASGWELPMTRSVSCQKDDREYPRNPSPEVIECAAVYVSGAEFGSRTYYALLADGSIKSWNQSSSMLADGLMYLCVMSVGLLLGIVVFVFFMRRKSMKVSGE